MYFITENSIISVNPNHIDSVIINEGDEGKYTVVIETAVIKSYNNSGDVEEYEIIEISCNSKSAADDILNAIAEMLIKENDVADWRALEVSAIMKRSYES